VRLLSICLCVLGSACEDRIASPAAATDSGAPPGARELPVWAVQLGQDAYGSWADFEVDGRRTRLRSISKGAFTMGSPEAEAGRAPDELQHEVTLTHDYWLAESECTQALWQLVMDGNPSHFVSDERPVEEVTWPDVQLFLQRLNERVPGLDARLPTEAEWEYGSRAKTTSQTYAGELQVVGMYNAPVLDDIAWYGGNSGVGFELDNGIDASSWPDKQYADATVGSHPVMGKQPNRWGVYDSLGNLWEWCQDWFGAYDAGPVVDPQGPATGDGRVIRGGSWGNYAADMRVANRNQGTPADKAIILGFRIARGAD
jgi:formylglycine-generating enzyme required for sulfatase activity